jgi:hypothetical protein
MQRRTTSRSLALFIGMLQNSAHRLSQSFIPRQIRYITRSSSNCYYNQSRCNARNNMTMLNQFMSSENREGPATKAAADHLQRNTFTLSDLLAYLDQVESHLRRPSVHASECHYSYQSDNDETFFKYVGSTLAKPMLRTLIYGAMSPDNDHVNVSSTGTLSKDVDWDSEALRVKQRTEKVQFDERIREERVLLEFERMSSFVLRELKPSLLQLDPDLINTFVPDLQDKIDQVEAMAKCLVRGGTIESKSLIVFSRLASGRHYKGRLEEMVKDLAPQLLESYEEASRAITERDVFERLIQQDLVKGNNMCQTELRKRRITAAFECLDIFYPRNNENYNADGDASEDVAKSYRKESSLECSTLSGKITEASCLEYIEKQCQSSSRHSILTNVFINTRRNAEEKYKPPRPRRNKSTVIWTDEGGTDRYKICSEFDVLLVNELNEDMHQIKSIWEAKRTISPSTLYDVLKKKLAAVELLLNDCSAELVYKDRETTRTLQFAQSARLKNAPIFTFGIYGTELLHPTNAADSIRSVAGANVVSSSLDQVILAIERCVENSNSLLVVEVDTNRTLHIVEKLRALIKEKLENHEQIQIVLYVEKKIDFELK